MDEEKWREHYRKSNKHKVFVKVMLKNGKHFFFNDYSVWKEIKEYCESKLTFIEEMHFQFRSHKCVLNLGDPVGVYLIRSVMGEMGCDSVNFLTLGLLKEDGMVHKQMWMVPELLKDMEYTDPIEDCFEEAIIYNEEKKANAKKQVQA